MKNSLIKCILYLAKFFKVRSNPPKEGGSFRLLIISTTGLGDTLWGVPALRALRKRYPIAHIGLLTSPIGKSLLKHCPYIDTVIVAKEPVFLSFFKLLKLLRKHRFQKGIVFHTSERLILPLCILSGISEIIGTKGINKGLDTLLTKTYPKKYEHEIIRRLSLSKCPHEDTKLELFLTDHDQAFAESIPKDQLLIGLHPGAKDRFKMWDSKHFIHVGTVLQEALNAKIFITGSLKEKSLMESIAQEIPGATPLVGPFPINITAAIMQHFSLFITNDTGPMHMAFALNIPTIALFCATDPHLCGALNLSNVQMIKKEKTCRPCLRKKCRTPFCIEQISPEEVISTALNMLKMQKGVCHV